MSALGYRIEYDYPKKGGGTGHVKQYLLARDRRMITKMLNDMMQDFTITEASEEELRAAGLELETTEK